MLQGSYRKLLGKWKFDFRIRDFTSAAFKSCSEIKRSMGKASYREGGALVPFKEPALVEYDDLTLSRGTCYDRDMYNWCEECASVSQSPPGGAGRIMADLLRPSRLQQLERNGEPAILWKFTWSWPGDYSAGDFDNDAEEVSMETFVLVYHHFDREDVGSSE